MSAELINNAAMQPGYQQADITRGIPYTIAVGAPTYPMITRVILPTMLRMAPDAMLMAPYHKTDHLLRLRGKHGPTHIYFISTTNTTSWQGQDLYGVWLDEFALMKESMFDEAQVRLANRAGWLLMSGTPAGPNWAKERVYDIAQTEEGRKEYYFTSWRTIDNPHFPRDELARLRRTMDPKQYRRNFEASFDAFSGQIYEDYLDELHSFDPQKVFFNLPNGRRIGGTGGSAGKRVRLQTVIAGVDWGFGIGHPGVITVLGWDAQRRTWWVLDEAVDEGVLVVNDSGRDSWVARAQSFRARYGISTFYCDHNPEHMAQFRTAGLPVQAAKKAVKPGIQCVTQYLRVINPEDPDPTTHLRISNVCKRLRSEMVFYHWKEGPGGRIGREEPAKENDHSVDTLRYAIYSHDQGSDFDREAGYVA